MHLKHGGMFYEFHIAPKTNSDNQLVRKDMDVNEPERLSNITLRHQVKEQHFYCCSTYHSQSKALNNELGSYPKMSMKQPLVCSWVVLFTSGHKSHIWASLLFRCYLVYRILFPKCRLSTRKQNTGEVILQISSSLWPTSHYRVKNTDKKQSQGSHHVNSKKTRQVYIVWLGMTNWMDCKCV